jgi:pentalenene oxygenase
MVRNPAVSATTDLEDQSVPKVPGRLPLIGHSLRVMRDPTGFLNDARECGEIVEIQLGPQRAYLVCRPELVHEMLVADVRSYDKGGALFDEGRRLVGNALNMANGDEHRRQRRIIQPSFHPERIGVYTEGMSDEAATLADNLQAGQEINVLREMNKFTARVAAHVVLSVNADRETIDRMGQLFETYLDGLFFRIITPGYLRKIPTLANRRFNRALEELLALVGRLIAEARSGTEAQDAKGQGLLAEMLAARNEDGEPFFSDDDLKAQMIGMLIAATETTATALAWTFLALASHPEVEAGVQREVDEVLAGRAARPEDLPRLTYTRDVVTESLRVHPPIWILSRSATTDVELGGHRFAAGTEVFFSPYLLHHDPGVFQDPERFAPDRWDADQTSIPRKSWVPFGGGKYKCIGDHLAPALLTLTVATVSSRWRLRVAPGSKQRPRARVTLMPYGLTMIPEPRRPDT